MGTFLDLFVVFFWGSVWVFSMFYVMRACDFNEEMWYLFIDLEDEDEEII
jgi:hypothetical protein